MADIVDIDRPSSTTEPDVVICLDGEALDRLGPILRHALVGLVDQAISIRVASPDPRIAELALGPVGVIQHAPKGILGNRRRALRLAESLAPRPPSIIHATSHRSYALAAYLAEVFDADVVLQVTSARDCDQLARFPQARVDRVIAASAPLRSAVVEQLKFPADRVSLVRPGLAPAGHLACFEEPENAATLLCMAPLERTSGVDTLISAIQSLRGKFNLLTFLMGRGRHESALREMVRQRGLAASVIFADPLNDPTSAMREADIFVRPASDSTFAFDALEAMANGVVVIACSDSVNDHLRHEETAFVISQCSPGTLVEAITIVLQDREAAKQMATRAMDYVRKHHSMSEMAERTAKVYRELALQRATYSIGGP